MSRIRQQYLPLDGWGERRTEHGRNATAGDRPTRRASDLPGRHRELLDLFEPEAIFVDPATHSELRGHDQIREAVVAMPPQSHPRVEVCPPKAFVSGDIALVLSQWAMEATRGVSEAEARHIAAYLLTLRQ